MAGREAGEGTIYEDKVRNRWRALYYDKNPETGKVDRKCIYAKTRKEVVEKLNEVMYMKNNNMYLQKNDITLAEMIKNIREDKLASNVISEGQYATISWTLRIIENHDIGKMPIQKISSRDIQTFLNNNKHYSDSSIKKIYELIHGAFKISVKKKIISSNIMEDVIRPKSIQELKIIRALTLDEQAKITNYLKSVRIDEEPYKVCYLLEMYTGLRIGEALALKVSDIDMEKGKISITRTLTKDKSFNIVMNNRAKTFAGRRVLPIPDILKEELKEQLKIAENNKDKLLFICMNPKNEIEYVRHTSVNSILKRIFSRQLGFKTEGLSTHSLRHTYATRSIEAGMTPVVLQKLMGHTDVKITLNTYTSVFNEYKEEELDKVQKYLDKRIFSKKIVNEIEL